MVSFVSLAIQVVLGIVHWMKNSLKLYLSNSKRILIFEEEWNRTFSWRAQPLGRLLLSCTLTFPLLLGLDQWHWWMGIMFHFNFGVLRNTSHSLCGREPMPGEPCRCHWRVILPSCSIWSWKGRKTRLPTLKATCLFHGLGFCGRWGSYLHLSVHSHSFPLPVIDPGLSLDPATSG